MKLLWMAGWAAALAITVIMWASEVFAQQQLPQCASRQEMLDILHDRYGEILAGNGQQSAMVIWEITVHPDTGSWTLLNTRATGQSCVAATGGGWEPRPVLPNNPI